VNFSRTLGNSPRDKAIFKAVNRKFARILNHRSTVNIYWNKSDENKMLVQNCAELCRIVQNCAELLSSSAQLYE
jgi:hypothetical protein